ncbi:MAG: phospholipid scramblase family protein [Candidatus Kapabacteria bacterium]|nr:phospholipid scramblase family protein [Candidatus Kapabacteria bacterium]
MEKLTQVKSLIISQQKHWGEILSGFEMKNKYIIYDEFGKELYFAGEESSSLLGRLFLKSSRPFEILILDKQGNKILKLKRPFKFFFPELTVMDSFDNILGKIKWKFAFFKRLYTIYDPNGIEIMELEGPFFKPWTFNIIKNGIEQGKIVKRWSGAMKEMFTNADNFGITFPPDSDLKAKAILLGAVFLIDFVHFEYR